MIFISKLSLAKHSAKFTPRIAWIGAADVVIIVDMFVANDPWEFHIAQIFSCQKFHLF